jgi:hypothetical protein
VLYKKESITKSMLPEPRGGMDKTKTVPLLAHARAVAWIKRKKFPRAACAVKTSPHGLCVAS